jgi:hypothetical protein
MLREFNFREAILEEEISNWGGKKMREEYTMYISFIYFGNFLIHTFFG